MPILIPRLRELLEANKGEGYVCPCHANSIYNAVNRACEKLGYPKIGVHGLRHTFASLCYHQGIPELAAMKLGGWSDYATMRRIYTHLANQDLQSAADNLTGFFAS